MKSRSLLFLFALAFTNQAQAQDKAPPAVPQKQADGKAMFPDKLPGKGLAQHDFLYAGEAKDRRIYIVKNGKIVWTYDDPAGKGEISDAVMLSNGRIVIAHQYAVKVIDADKKVLWNQDAPKGTEIHTAQPIGKEHVVYVQNGDPALVKVVNITSGTTVKEFPLPTKNSKGVHGQFRHARLTADGTLMVAHMDSGKLAEYDIGGKELWSMPRQGIWGVTPLKNGNFLISGGFGVLEVNRKKETVWSLAKGDLPDYRLPNLQMAWRLPNGNTLFNIWVNQWSGPVDKAKVPVQALEVTPDKKVAWALRSWADPDLGPSTTIQILDTKETPEDVRFGDIK
jgi:outer membrane protein assembly factor BamB